MVASLNPKGHDMDIIPELSLCDLAEEVEAPSMNLIE